MDNKKKAMLEVLTKTLGIVTTACEKCGIARQTHYDWMNKDPEYKQAVDDIDNIVIDFAESKLYELVKNAEPSAVYFLLKTRGKKRGYSERTEIEVTNPEPIIINFPKDYKPLPSSEEEAEKNM